MTQETEKPFTHSLQSLIATALPGQLDVKQAALDLNFLIITHNTPQHQIFVGRFHNTAALLSADNSSDGIEARQQYPELFARLDAMTEQEKRRILGLGAIQYASEVQKRIFDTRLGVATSMYPEDPEKLTRLQKFIEDLSQRTSPPPEPLPRS